jgi:hypothetical protein
MKTKDLIEHAIKLHAEYHCGRSGLSDKDCLESIMSIIATQQAQIISTLRGEVEKLSRTRMVEPDPINPMERVERDYIKKEDLDALLDKDIKEVE